jgi:hypothetical protein
LFVISAPFHSVVTCENPGEGYATAMRSLAHERLAIAAIPHGHPRTDCPAARSRVLPVAKPEDARGLFDTTPDNRPFPVAGWPPLSSEHQLGLDHGRSKIVFGFESRSGAGVAMGS